MFAVPGWSVSADALKSETVSKTADSSSANTSKNSSRKRKRGGAASEQVTASNVANLYETVVEGRAPEKHNPEGPAKKQKKNKAGQDDKPNGTKKQSAEDGPADAGVKGDKKKKDKKKQNQKGHDSSSSTKDEADQQKSKSKGAITETAANVPPPLPPAPPKLTPLQASMRQKLVSARFRHLNETLYTTPSEEAYSLFEESPEMFDEYHEGFRQQVKVWPENPVDSFLADIRARGKIRAPPPGKGGGGGGHRGSRPPLPRTAGTCTVADLGCGDARLAESLQSDKAKLRLQVHSYDLRSPSPLVTKADIANLPLEDGSVNVAIFCLALMGTNWVDFVEEAYRILHWKGELWVAEIKSRFGPVRNKNAPVTHSVGNRKKSGKKGKGAGGNDEDGSRFEDDLAVEVDGVDDRRKETDVSAFVEVLRKRGFVLQGEQREAIDKSNKMFVKMHFIKGAAPTKGKGAKEEEPGRNGKKWIAKRDLERGDDAEPEMNEASVLKPCVYKIR